MKLSFLNHLRLLFLAVFTLVSGSLVFGQSLRTSAHIRNQMPKDNPQARGYFEWLKLHDPKTGTLPKNIREKELEFLKNSSDRLSSQRVQSLEPLEPWINRGPYNVGGRTRALAVDITDENIILAGGVSGGLWRSADFGETWTKTTAPTDIHSITSIAQDPRPGFTNIWYYTSGELSGNSASEPGAFYLGDGLFKSIDRGLTWTRLDSTVSDTPQIFESCFDLTHEVVVNPTNGDVILASFCGIYISKDQGLSWEVKPVTQNQSTNARWTDVVVTSNGRIYAYVGTAGLFTSSDNGDTWEDITPTGFPFTNSQNRAELALAPSNQDLLYVIYEGGNVGGYGLQLYNRSDSSWRDRSSGIPQLGGQTGNFDSQGGYDLLIKVHPTDPNFVVIGGTNLFRSTNGFTNPSGTGWIGGYTATNSSFGLYPNHHPDQHSFVFLPSNPDQALSGNDGGVQFTENIRSSLQTTELVKWAPLNNGYLTTQTYAISLGPGDQIVAGFQDNGTWMTNSTDSDFEWSSQFGGDGAWSAISSNGKFRWYSAQFAQTFRVTFANANSFDATGFSQFEPSEYGDAQLFIVPFELDPSNDSLFYLGGTEILWINSNSISESPNENWRALALGEGVISAFGVTKSDTLYVGTSDGEVFRLRNLKTTGSAVQVGSSGLLADGYITTISTNEFNAKELIVGFSNYGIRSIFYSADAGTTWRDVSGNLEENEDGSGSGPSIRSSAILGNGEIYFVGTSTGLYYTQDILADSVVWLPTAQNSIGNVVVSHLLKKEVDGTLVAATHANGIYSGRYSTENSIKLDLAAGELINPIDGVSGGTESVSLLVQNKGTQSITSFTAGYSINDEVIVLAQSGPSLSPGESIEFQFTTTFSFSTPGVYELKAWVDISDDERTTNDTTETIINKFATVSTLPISQLFETDNGGWIGSGDWEWAAPSGTVLSGALEGEKSWITNGDGQYSNLATSFLISPIFDFSEIVNKPTVRFKIQYDTEVNFDGIIFAYRTSLSDGFTYLDESFGIEGWYSGLFSAFGNLGWTGSSEEVVEAAAELDFLSGEKIVQFAFVLITDELVTAEGILMDDFRIEVFSNQAPTDISLSTESLSENFEIGEVFASLQSEDKDNASHTYSLVSGEGDTHNSYFIVEQDILILNTELDFETLSSLSIRIKSDDGDGGLFEKVFQLSVLDGNDAPTLIELSRTDIPDESPVGYTVGKFTASDPNNDVLAIKLTSGEGSTDNNRFFLSSGDLKLNEKATFTIRPTYEILVIADDLKGGKLTKSFQLSVNAPLGITNLASAGIKMYPNPVVEDKLMLKIQNEFKGNISFYLFDFNGKEVIRRDFNKIQESHTENFDIKSLPAGVYLLDIRMGTSKRTAKILKN